MNKDQKIYWHDHGFQAYNDDIIILKHYWERESKLKVVRSQFRRMIKRQQESALFVLNVVVGLMECICTWLWLSEI